MLKIKPFSVRYSEKCADLLQFLWKNENKEQRLNHFIWEYQQNPNNDDVITAVIAVNENDDVIGFRGYHLLQGHFGNKTLKIAYIADTVVSPSARRQGIFQKMSEYSLNFLIENGIYCIGNLGPSWPPYYGYKKLLFEDLSLFHRKFKFILKPLVEQFLLKKNRVWHARNERMVQGSYQFVISTIIPDNILRQIPNVQKDGFIFPCRDFQNVRWKANHPEAKYIYAYSIDSSNQVQSFMWLKTKDGYRYFLALYFSSNMANFKQLYSFVIRTIKPSIIEVWTWALSNNAHECLKTLHFLSLPLLNKIKKNPPALVRSLLLNNDHSINWEIEGIDIRDCKKWVVDKFEADSF